MCAKSTVRRPLAGNETLRRLVCLQCRVHGQEADETLRRDVQAVAQEAVAVATRDAAFQALRADAGHSNACGSSGATNGHAAANGAERADGACAAESEEMAPGAQVVALIRRVADGHMAGVSLERYCDRKQPFVLAYNVVNSSWSKSSSLKEAARSLCMTELAAHIGERRASAVNSLCHHAAWLEQNIRDWDGAQAGSITGAARGYRRDMDKERDLLEKATRQLGFDDCA
eukprot:TRINITY_DN22969_c0_g1_i1.p1 TRINITY_DN22969_c0_g1~~TRINITY_DN22969_c0_g1_i1.p1  ORF type:complete len:242 (+),score=43.52 TRINITY_DN22969_c0_g1_i1:37-726(+)